MDIFDNFQQNPEKCLMAVGPITSLEAWEGGEAGREGGERIQNIDLSDYSTGTPQRSRIMVPTSPKLGSAVSMDTTIWIGASSFVDFSVPDWAGLAGLAGWLA